MADSTQSKRCPKCGERKVLLEFSRDKHRPDGLTVWCRSCKRASDRAYRQTAVGKEKTRQRVKRWVAANPERAAEHYQRWRDKNPDWSAENNRKWREANPGAAAAYHAADREKAMLRTLRRRKRLAESRIGPVDLPTLWLVNDGICPLCGEPIDRELRHPNPLSPSLDHIVPLSKGGHHAQDNLQWTHLVCNIRKGATVPD